MVEVLHRIHLNLTAHQFAENSQCIKCDTGAMLALVLSFRDQNNLAIDDYNSRCQSRAKASPIELFDSLPEAYTNTTTKAFIGNNFYFQWRASTKGGRIKISDIVFRDPSFAYYRYALVRYYPSYDSNRLVISNPWGEVLHRVD